MEAALHRSNFTARSRLLEGISTSKLCQQTQRKPGFVRCGLLLYVPRVWLRVRASELPSKCHKQKTRKSWSGLLVCLQGFQSRTLKVVPLQTGFIRRNVGTGQVRPTPGQSTRRSCILCACALPVAVTLSFVRKCWTTLEAAGCPLRPNTEASRRFEHHGLPRAACKKGPV